MERESERMCFNGSLCVFSLSSSFLCLCVICLSSLAFTTTKDSKGNSEFEFQWSGNTCKPGQTGHAGTHTHTQTHTHSSLNRNKQYNSIVFMFD